MMKLYYISGIALGLLRQDIGVSFYEW